MRVWPEKTKLMKAGKNEFAEITVRDTGGKFGAYLARSASEQAGF
jgi:hypothetical protein